MLHSYNVHMYLVTNKQWNFYGFGTRVSPLVNRKECPHYRGVLTSGVKLYTVVVSGDSSSVLFTKVFPFGFHCAYIISLYLVTNKQWNFYGFGTRVSPLVNRKECPHYRGVLTSGVKLYTVVVSGDSSSVLFTKVFPFGFHCAYIISLFLLVILCNTVILIYVHVHDLLQIVTSLTPPTGVRVPGVHTQVPEHFGTGCSQWPGHPPQAPLPLLPQPPLPPLPHLHGVTGHNKSSSLPPKLRPPSPAHKASQWRPS